MHAGRYFDTVDYTDTPSMFLDVLDISLCIFLFLSVSLYLSVSLSRCCNGHVTKVEWALLGVLYPALTQAFLVAPKGTPTPATLLGDAPVSGASSSSSSSSSSDSSESESSGSEESGDEKGGDGGGGETKQNDAPTHWVLVTQGQDPVAMNVAQMKQGLIDGSLKDNTYVCQFRKQKWVGIRNFC